MSRPKGMKLTPEHRAKIRASVLATWRNDPNRVAYKAITQAMTDRLVDALPGTVEEVARKTGMSDVTVRGKLTRLTRDGRAVRRREPGNRGGAWTYYAATEGER